MAVQAVLNGADVTANILAGSVTHQHNRPSFATIRMPSWATTAGDTSRLKVVLDGSLDFHGLCVHIEDQGDEDRMYSTFTFSDPTLLFEMRPARDGPASSDPGDFSKPSFIERNVTAPQMLKEVLEQSLNGSNPADGEGPMGISLGSFATGGVNLKGAPADWPMSIAQVIALLVETGELDVVCTPIDVGGNMGSISAHNGNYGSNLSGSVSFQYAHGSFNARGCRRTTDLRELCNKLWIYGGPREKTKNDPSGDQHWAFNVTRDDKDLPNPPQSTISAAIDASRASYFVRMAIRIFDGHQDVLLRELYRRWWQQESWLRLRPKVMVAITPQRGIKPAFRTGDLISVSAGSKFRGGFSGAQRVMEYTYRWDENGVVELGEPVGMPGAAGAPPVLTTDVAEGI